MREGGGQFMLTDRRYCYPLIITDAMSRHLLCCDALKSTQASYAYTVFERTFKDLGCRGPSAPTTVSPSPVAVSDSPTH